MKKYAAVSLMFLLSGCAGMKVVKPGEQNKDANTKMVDWSGGSPKIVSTYSCKLDSMGNKFSAVGKSEAEASQEVVAKCRDHTAISSCDSKKVTCVKN